MDIPTQAPADAGDAGIPSQRAEAFTFGDPVSAPVATDLALRSLEAVRRACSRRDARVA